MGNDKEKKKMHVYWGMRKSLWPTAGLTFKSSLFCGLSHMPCASALTVGRGMYLKAQMELPKVKQGGHRGCDFRPVLLWTWILWALSDSRMPPGFKSTPALFKKMLAQDLRGLHQDQGWVEAFPARRKKAVEVLLKCPFLKDIPIYRPSFYYSEPIMNLLSLQK